jgi:hypothetical protein
VTERSSHSTGEGERKGGAGIGVAMQDYSTLNSLQ